MKSTFEAFVIQELKRVQESIIQEYRTGTASPQGPRTADANEQGISTPLGVSRDISVSPTLVSGDLKTDLPGTVEDPLKYFITSGATHEATDDSPASSPPIRSCSGVSSVDARPGCLKKMGSDLSLDGHVLKPSISMISGLSGRSSDPLSGLPEGRPLSSCQNSAAKRQEPERPTEISSGVSFRAEVSIAAIPGRRSQPNPLDMRAGRLLKDLDLSSNEGEGGSPRTSHSRASGSQSPHSARTGPGASRESLSARGAGVRRPSMAQHSEFFNDLGSALSSPPSAGQNPRLRSPRHSLTAEKLDELQPNAAPPRISSRRPSVAYLGPGAADDLKTAIAAATGTPTNAFVKLATAKVDGGALLEGPLTCHQIWIDQCDEDGLDSETKVALFRSGWTPDKRGKNKARTVDLDVLASPSNPGSKPCSARQSRIFLDTGKQETPMTVRRLSGASASSATRTSIQQLAQIGIKDRMQRYCRRSCKLEAHEPSNTKRMLWDSFGVVLIFYDMVFIPMTIFDLQSNLFFVFMQWLALVFWSFDIPASFFVGFHTNGTLEMGLAEIRKKYIKTFLPMDVLLVLIDVVVIVLERTESESGGSTDPSGVARVAKSYRILRILRGLRLIRLMKLPSKVSHLQEHIQSDTVVVSLGVLKLTICILMINHFVACLWYGVSSTGTNHGSWLAPHNLDDTTTHYIYMTALHWSLTQFTPASMEVHATTFHERAFTVVVIVFALVTFSSFVSSITNAMTGLSKMNEEQAKRLSMLQRYFRSNSISLSLCIRVRRHIDYKLLMRVQDIQEKDVMLLQLLSGPLRIELHHEVFSAFLNTHPFFVQFDTLQRRCVKMICHEAVDCLHVSEGDTIFCRGDHAKKFFIIKHGHVTYARDKDSTDGVSVKVGEFIAEAVLWTPWVHHGEAKCESESTMVVLDSLSFQTCVLNNPVSMASPAHYATIFVEHLNKLLEAGKDLSDLRDSTFDHALAVDLTFIDPSELMEAEATMYTHSTSQRSSDSRETEASEQSEDKSDSSKSESNSTVADEDANAKNEDGNLVTVVPQPQEMPVTLYVEEVLHT